MPSPEDVNREEAIWKHTETYCTASSYLAIVELQAKMYLVEVSEIYFRGLWTFLVRF